MYIYIIYKRFFFFYESSLFCNMLNSDSHNFLTLSIFTTQTAKCGYLEKLGESFPWKWKKRWFVVDPSDENNVIRYFKTSEMSEIKGFIDLLHVTEISSDGFGSVLKLVTKSRTWEIRLPSETRDIRLIADWQRAIRRALSTAESRRKQPPRKDKVVDNSDGLNVHHNFGSLLSQGNGPGLWNNMLDGVKLCDIDEKNNVYNPEDPVHFSKFKVRSNGYKTFNRGHKESCTFYYFF